MNICRSLAVIGVGNMAKAIIAGMLRDESSSILASKIYLFDVNKEQYSNLLSDTVLEAESAHAAIDKADAVLISVKPQNYSNVLDTISSVNNYEKKLYISIGAGISTDYIKEVLGDVSVVRALPNLPMVIGKGVTAICENNSVCEEDMRFVQQIFASSGSILMIDESEMNRIIGVTSSSPAYVFKFIDAMCEGARAQGIDSEMLLGTVCDMVIGSALMLKNSEFSPKELISKVASKGGTTEQALLALDANRFDDTVIEAMCACTKRADELGKVK